MRVQKASFTSPLVSLYQSALDCLVRNDDDSIGNTLLCGTSKDGTLGWQAKGSALEVFRLATGARVAAWCFGAVLKDVHTSITAVCEYFYDGNSKLVVGTESPTTHMLCLFDVRSAKVIKAIEVPHKVTSLEPVTSVGPAHIPKMILCDHLRYYCGALAVGTHCGHIYLIDMCLDDESEGCTELRPNSVVSIDPSTTDVMTRRYNAFNRGQHLCLKLSDNTHSRGYYYYRKPDGSIIKTYSADDTIVTALKFVPSTGLLAVGFNFGCFQLWRLFVPSLEYSSRLSEDLAPVTHFAYQEPENDPRNFVYLWVVRGPLLSDSIQDHCASLSLFQLGFARKVQHEGFGCLYEDLTSAGPRFDHALTCDPYSAEGDDVGSRVISCYTLEDPSFCFPDSTDGEDSFEGSSNPDLSLCVMMWEVAPSDPHCKSDVYLGLFDMNRWYHAQMPTAIRFYGGGHDSCPYFSVCSLDTSLEAANPDSLLAVHIGYHSLSRFNSPILPPPEQHFYPSAMAFEVTCVTHTGMVHTKYLGVQRQILATIQSHGPDCLAEPHDVYNLCLQAGLLPRTVEISNHLPAMYKRDVLLSMALEHNLMGLISACVSRWSSGDFTGVGCTLRSILEWAWKKSVSIKESIDAVVAPLYDWSGDPLDAQTLQQLHQHQLALSQITTIFQSLGNHSIATTNQGRQELEMKVTAVSLLSQHVAMVMFFYNSGLLPECADDDIPNVGLAYPSRSLRQAYRHRREDIEKLHSELSATDVLLIDGLHADTSEALGAIWQQDGGNGHYPPSSLNALLKIFLVESMSLRSKHQTVFYLLCDLLNLQPEERQPSFQQKLHDFSQSFCLSPGLAKMVQGMWLLDHQDFKDGLVYLLDPMVQSEMLPWQHTRIIKSFLYQGKHQMALKYIRIKKPPLVSPEDVKLRLTVLLANGLTSEAFEYQRSCRDQLNAPDFLTHLLQGCRETRTIDQLLHLPFSEEEEGHLVTQLRTSREQKAQELLVLYYLQRSRFIEAIRLNNRLRQSGLGDMDPASRERARVRNSIVDGYQRVLPAVQKRLALGAEQPLAKRAKTRREFVRPTPLSMVVSRAERGRVMTRSQLVQSILEQVKEVHEVIAEDNQEDDRPGSPVEDEDKPGPFVCTPLSVKRQSRVPDVHEVVFPSTSGQGMESGPLGLGSPLGPRSPLRPSPYSSPVNPQIARLTGSIGKRKSRKFTAEALTLLSTPPVKRRPRGSQGPGSLPSTPGTPHSILKVRSRPALIRTPSPTREVNKPKSFAELVLPTPPRPQRLATLSRGAESAVMDTPEPRTPTKTSTDTVTPVGTPGTPSKQLRFVEPPKEVLNEPPPEAGEHVAKVHPVAASLSPTRQAPPHVAVSLLRSSKDRSPTPEITRQSPHHEPHFGRDEGRLPWETMPKVMTPKTTSSKMTKFTALDEDIEMEVHGEDIPLPLANSETEQAVLDNGDLLERADDNMGSEVITGPKVTGQENGISVADLPETEDDDVVVLDSDSEEEDEDDLEDEEEDESDEDEDEDEANEIVDLSDISPGSQSLTVTSGPAGNPLLSEPPGPQQDVEDAEDAETMEVDSESSEDVPHLALVNDTEGGEDMLEDHSLMTADYLQYSKVLPKAVAAEKGPSVDIQEFVLPELDEEQVDSTEPVIHAERGSVHEEPSPDNKDSHMIEMSAVTAEKDERKCDYDIEEFELSDVSLTENVQVLVEQSESHSKAESVKEDSKGVARSETGAEDSQTVDSRPQESSVISQGKTVSRTVLSGQPVSGECESEPEESEPGTGQVEPSHTNRHAEDVEIVEGVEAESVPSGSIEGTNEEPMSSDKPKHSNVVIEESTPSDLLRPPSEEMEDESVSSVEVGEPHYPLRHLEDIEEESPSLNSRPQPSVGTEEQSVTPQLTPAPSVGTEESDDKATQAKTGLDQDRLLAPAGDQSAETGRQSEVVDNQPSQISAAGEQLATVDRRDAGDQPSDMGVKEAGNQSDMDMTVDPGEKGKAPGRQTRPRRQRRTAEVSIADLLEAEAQILNADPLTPTRRTRSHDLDTSIQRSPARTTRRKKSETGDDQEQPIIARSPGRKSPTRMADSSAPDTELDVSVRKSPSRKAKTAGKPQDTSVRKSPARKAKTAAQQELDTSVQKSPGRKTKTAITPLTPTRASRRLNPDEASMETEENQGENQKKAPTRRRTTSSSSSSGVRRSSRRATLEVLAEEVAAAEKCVTSVPRRKSRSPHVVVAAVETTIAEEKLTELMHLGMPFRKGLRPPTAPRGDFKTPSRTVKSHVRARVTGGVEMFPLSTHRYSLRARTGSDTQMMLTRMHSEHVNSEGLRRSPRLAAKRLARETTPSRGHRVHRKTVNSEGLRRSPRLAAKRLAREGPKAEFKTPSGRSRGVSVLPPTPPESGTGSPSSTGSMAEARPSQRVTRQKSRSRDPSPVAEMPPQTGTRGTRSRTSSRTSASDLELQNGDMAADEALGKQQEIEDGPLSQDSFMMRLRTTRLAREATPESWQTSETGSALSEDEFVPGEEMKFTFSEPTAVNGDSQRDEGTEVLAMPFVFSPPITRAQRRNSLRGSAHKVIDPALAQDSKKKSRKREKSSSTLPTDSPINFLSPVQEESSTKATTRGRDDSDAVTRQLRPKGQGNLAKFFGSKRKPLQW